MMRIPYPMHVALQSIWREKWINLLTIFAVAASLLMVTLMYFALFNLDRFAGKLPERFSIAAYLKDGISPQETDALIAQIKKQEYVADVKLISKEQAITDLKKAIADIGSVLEGMQDNPLSSSLEIRLKQEYVSASSVKKIAAGLKSLPGIDSIYEGEKIAETIAHIKHSVMVVGIALFTIISFGVVFVIYSSVKNLFYRKRDDIEILKLLGATAWFIRGPFLMEGGVIGLFGGVFGLLGAYACFFLLTTQLSADLPILRLLEFPHAIVVALPLIGLAFGIFGAIVAIGRIRFS